MRLQSFHSDFNINMDIKLRTQLKCKNAECSEKAIADTTIKYLPILEKRLNHLYKLTGKHYNNILNEFIKSFLLLENGNEAFCNLLSYSRNIKIPHHNNISFYVANYVLSSTDTEIVSLNEGLQILIEYFEWQNRNNNCKILENYTENNKSFICHCGNEILNSTSKICCVYLPLQYILNGRDSEVKKIENIIGIDKIEKFKNNLKILSDTCDKLQNMKNIKSVFDPRQQTLDKYL